MSDLLADFQRSLQATRSAKILELGTMRSIPTRSTHHRAWAAADASYVMSDFQNGFDVDVLADIHALATAFALDSFDFVIACSVFEHVQRPWIAAREIARVLKPNGQVFIQTHNAFPIHGYPSDYWRYTEEALQTIFEDAGLETVGTSYNFPAQIHSEELPGTADYAAFLNVCIVARKPPTWQEAAATAVADSSGVEAREPVSHAAAVPEVDVEHRLLQQRSRDAANDPRLVCELRPGTDSGSAKVEALKRKIRKLHASFSRKVTSLLREIRRAVRKIAKLGAES